MSSSITDATDWYPEDLKDVLPILYCLWTLSSGRGKDGEDDSKWATLNTKDGISTHAHINGTDQISMFEINFTDLLDILEGHLRGLTVMSEFSSRTACLPQLLSRAKKVISKHGQQNAYINIIIASCFGGKDIYHVPDICNFGLGGMEDDIEGTYPWEYLVHGPVSGTGFATFSVSMFSDHLGSLWQDLEALDSWGADTEESFDKPATESIEEEFKASEKTACLIMQAFQDQQTENLNFIDLYITTQLFCMHRRSWWTDGSPEQSSLAPVLADLLSLRDLLGLKTELAASAENLELTKRQAERFPEMLRAPGLLGKIGEWLNE